MAPPEKPPILLVEDDIDWIEQLTDYLGDDYEVCPVTSLREAQQSVRALPFHLAIVDISLILRDSGDDGGFRFIQELRTREILCDMSIIIVTAYPTTDRVRKAFKKYKVYDFIDKARLDSEEFRQVVAEAIAVSYLGSLRL